MLKHGADADDDRRTHSIPTCDPHCRDTHMDV